MSEPIDPPALRSLLDDADFVDVQSVEGEVTLREFVAHSIGWEPGWLRALYLARRVFARLLRLAHRDVVPGSDLAPAEIPFTPGRKIGFFTVVEGVEDRYLLLEATDSHLAAYLAILAETAGPGRRRFRMVTVVKHLHWTGPLYFAVIRPFHYMVVRGMGRAGARRPGREAPAPDSGRPAAAGRPSPAARVLSAAVLPVAPLYGAALAYRLFHPPRRRHHRRPQDFGLAATVLAIPLGGGGRLHAWLCPGAPDRVVVLGHGIGLSKSASLAHAKFLHDAGFTVCLFDHRNHGASGHDRARMRLGERFTDDITATVTHLRRAEGYGSARLAVYGFSFSTFPSLYSLAREGFGVDAVVCDSGPGDDLPQLFGNFLEAGGLPLPSPLRGPRPRAAVAGTLGSLATAMLGASWPPPADGPLAHVPLLFMSGGRDRILPASSVQALAGRYPRAETHVLPDADHLTGLKTDPGIYTTTVLDFLERALR
ncbi:alpha/beta fold hydrolase [Streptosporangium sp. NPDC003464]